MSNRLARFAAAWVAIDAADAARSLLNDLWNQLRAEQAFYPTVKTDPDGHGRIDVHCDWPDEIRQAVEGAAGSFVDALGNAFDSALLAIARIVCAAIGEPDAAVHRMLYLITSQEFWQVVQDGYYTGLRPDQIRLIETFQPFDEFDRTVRPEAMMVRTAMRHFRNMLPSPCASDHSDRIAVWAHSAEPEIFIDPPGQVLSVDSSGDGVLEKVRTVAT